MALLIHTLAIVSLCGAALAVSGPARLGSSPFLEPDACTVWRAGGTAHVAWLPPDDVHHKGGPAMVALEWPSSEDGPPTGRMLAVGVAHDEGELEVHVPRDLDERQDYRLRLFGAGGGISEPFCIIGADELAVGPDGPLHGEAEAGQMVLQAD